MTEIFQQNLSRWSLISPEAANKVAAVECTSVALEMHCGHENLCRKIDSTLLWYHADDPIKEAEEWFASLDLYQTHVLYVHGVGLGYYFEAALEWLKNPFHFLVFLEHDAEVVHRLFETQRGSRLLLNKQVRLYLLNDRDSENDTLRQVSQLFFKYVFYVSALKFYLERQGEVIRNAIQADLEFWTYLHRVYSAEYRDAGRHFFLNFYQNLLNLPKAGLVNGLYKQFKDLPAIICGAGPSLDKNLDVLKTLTDKALIFAGGTAMNAVNSHGLIPHWGVGIDPNETQRSRLIMNTAYEVPYLYRSRMNHPSLNLIHGVTVYVPGSSSYLLPEWFEEQLKISSEVIEEGFNVINFSLSLACAMGCNPIILVGVDLAYTDMKSYPSGVKNHPTYIKQEDFKTKNEQDELIIRKDIYGNPVTTLWKWITESLWIALQAKLLPGTLFINASEGGIGMEGIVNVPLNVVAESFLISSHGMSLRVHGEIQNHLMPTEVTHAKIVEQAKILQESLKKAIEYCQILAENENKEVEKQLHEEVAYRYLIKQFEEQHLINISLEKQQLIYDNVLDPETRIRFESLIEKGKNQLLKFAATLHFEMLQKLVINSLEPEKCSFLNSGIPADLSFPENIYSFENGVLNIIDKELHLEIHTVKNEALEAKPIYYPHGVLKIEQYYIGKHLHGPLTFFSENGSILAKGWYVNGKQQGKIWLFYSSGSLYALQQMKEGIGHGVQRYYYPCGAIKTIFNYEMGLLDGVVRLYYSNGQLKRELHFKMGKHCGTERMWDSRGQLLLEAQYQDDMPMGRACTWYPTGELSSEILWEGGTRPLSVTRWRENGEKIPEKTEDVNYFSNIVKSTGRLTQCLKDVSLQMGKISLVIESKEQMQGIEKSFAKLKESLEHLEKMGKNVFEQSTCSGSGVDEPLWQTPTTQREVEKRLEEVRNKLHKDLSSIQTAITDMQNLNRPLA